MTLPARRILMIATGGALFLSGCTGGVTPYQRAPVAAPQQPVVPAYVLGEAIDGNAARQRKARAAGLRPLPPAEVASYVTRQEMDLRRQTAGTGVDVIRSGDLLLIRLPSVGTFDAGQTAIRPQALSTLTEIALTLKSFNRSLVDVLGHTDSTGTVSANKTVSERRAQAVARHLTSRGVASARIATRGYAAAYPIGDNATESGRALNRRVEIKVSPLR